MEHLSAKLEPKLVGDVNGRFFIPDYQRGYRWGRQNVRQLLEDISDNQSSGNAYYLQPIVLCPHSSKGDDGFDYDVIDGQQRLTTLFIIYQVLQSINKEYEDKTIRFISADDVACNFSIFYQTRDGSEEYLNNLSKKTLTDAREYIDYLYMYHAYKEVQEWMQTHADKIAIIAKSLKANVFLIWYEVNANEDQARAIFERLNIGKIRLTNAELVKALFLSETSSNADSRDKNIIGEQWDDIERQLHDSMLWSFLTNKDASQYATRIELLFDMIASRKDNERDEFATFLYFDKHLKGKDKKKEWDKIYIQFLKLKDWYNDRRYYHKIGYLVSVGKPDELQSLYNESCKEDMTNSRFAEWLDERIKESVDFKTIRIEDLAYKENYADIRKLLTLFNVMSMQELKDESQRYPFHLHKTVDGGWSLEHIHAQHSETLNTAKQWILWAKLHLDSLKRYHNIKKIEDTGDKEIRNITELEKQMQSFIDNPNLQKQSVFNDLTGIYAHTVIVPGGTENKDLLSNLALLGRDDNSMLNNSTFDVKREIVTRELMAKSYVPLCTQRVFLKSYTPADKNQLFFWGEADREAYINEIKRVVAPYLPPLSRQVPKVFKKVFKESSEFREEFDNVWNLFTDKMSNENRDINLFLKEKAGSFGINDALTFYENMAEKFKDSNITVFEEQLKTTFEL